MPSTTNRRFSSVNSMPDNYPELGWSVATYRWLIFKRQENGFHRCLMKANSRWAIDLDVFEDWMESHRGLV